MTTVAIYTRLSQDRDGTQTATERQEAACRQYAASKGWTVGPVFTDVDLSAYRKGVVRPGFEDLVDAVARKEVDGVLAWKLDRLVRNHADFERLWSVLDDNQALLASAMEPVDTDSEVGMMLTRLLVGFARLESSNISTRGRAANEALARKGKPHGSGQRAFGYERGFTAQVPVEADAVRDAVKRIIDRTTNPGALAREWNAAGIPTTSGGQWRPFSLRRMLMNPYLAGVRCYKGEPVAQGEWDAIIDLETHEKVVRVLKDAARSTGGGGAVRYTLSGGVLRCGLCGTPMVSRPREDKTRRYVCSTEPGRQSCGKVGIVAEPLEALVRDALVARLRPERVQAARDALTGADETRRALLMRLEDDELALREAATARFTERTLPHAEFTQVATALKERMEDTKRELRRLEVPVVDSLPTNIGDAWDSADHDWRRRMVAAFVDSITVAPARRGLNRFDAGRVQMAWCA